MARAKFRNCDAKLPYPDDVPKRSSTNTFRPGRDTTLILSDTGWRLLPIGKLITAVSRHPCRTGTPAGVEQAHIPPDLQKLGTDEPGIGP